MNLKAFLTDDRLADHGVLENRNLGRILFQLWTEKFSGIIRVQREPLQKLILLRDGWIETAISNDLDERLGERLILDGHLSIDDFLRATEVVIQTGKKLGAVLIEMGVLAAEDLLNAIKRQVRCIVFDAIRRKFGTFQVYWVDEEIPDLTLLHLNTPRTVFDGARQVQRLSVILNDLKDLQRFPVFRHTDAWPTLATQLSPEENHVVSLCNGRFSIHTICEMSYLSPFETLRLIWAFNIVNVVELAGTPQTEADLRVMSHGRTVAPAEYQEYVLQDLVQKFNEIYQTIHEYLLPQLGDRVQDFFDKNLDTVRQYTPHRLKNVAFNAYGEIDYDAFAINFSDLDYERKLEEMHRILRDIASALVQTLDQVIPPDQAGRLQEELKARMNEFL